MKVFKVFETNFKGFISFVSDCIINLLTVSIPIPIFIVPKCSETTSTIFTRPGLLNVAFYSAHPH